MLVTVAVEVVEKVVSAEMNFRFKNLTKDFSHFALLHGSGGVFRG